MTDKLQKVVWTGDETGEEWDLKHEQEKAYFEALSQTLRPCPQHGNPAALEDWREYGFVILADPCGCWLKEEFYDSTEEMVDAWNHQPYIDRLDAEIESLRARVAELEGELASLKAMSLYRRVELIDGESVEPVSVIGVHPVEWRDGVGLMPEPTHAFTRVEWEDGNE